MKTKNLTFREKARLEIETNNYFRIFFFRTKFKLHLYRLDFHQTAHLHIYRLNKPFSFAIRVSQHPAATIVSDNRHSTIITVHAILVHNFIE